MKIIIKYIIVFALISGVLSSCAVKRSSDTLNNEGIQMHNEINGQIAECMNEVYYIKDNTLESMHSGTIDENVIIVQTYNDLLYYIKNDSIPKIYQYNGLEKNVVSDIPKGHIKKALICNDEIYVLSDNELYKKV